MDTAESAPIESSSEVTQEQPQEHDFSFVLDKYRAEGRTDQDAAYEQAKGYAELQKKFGSFTGAPDEYELSISEDAAEHISMDDLANDPIYNDYRDIAKELGLNNEGFNRLAELYIKGQLADIEAVDSVRKAEMEQLGKDADRRLENIQDWARANLSAEDNESLMDSLTTAGSVRAVESLIAKTRNAPQQQDTQPAPSIDSGKLREMMLAKDEYGNRKMTSDKEYAAKVNKMYEQLYGKEPRSVTVG